MPRSETSRSLTRRRALALGALAAASGAGPGAADEKERSLPAAVSALVPLNLRHEPVPLDVRSHGVEWNGHTFHLVRLHEGRFSLSSRGHLTARVSGTVVTFDAVDYEVHAAVFDRAGALLGTARAVLPVERIWLGKCLTSPVELPLDFGISLAYRDAERLTMSISKREVLTPDQWTEKK